MFATCSWPSLCEQSELQCYRPNRRFCGSVQISVARPLPLTIDIQNLKKNLRFLLNNKVRRCHGAKHCSSLCSQSEGDEYCGGQARADNPTKSYPKALTMFATYSWPSLCEQSELQCFAPILRRKKRVIRPFKVRIGNLSADRLYYLILNTCFPAICVSGKLF